MSETWRHSRESIQRLRAALDEADEDTKYKFAFWLIGLSLMALAIVAQFGWAGLLFCMGAIVYAASNVNKPL